jgi:hypothetical protein
VILRSVKLEGGSRYVVSKYHFDKVFKVYHQSKVEAEAHFDRALDESLKDGRPFTLFLEDCLEIGGAWNPPK